MISLLPAYLFVAAFIFFTVTGAVSDERPLNYCSPSMPCWPTAADLANFTSLLNASGTSSRVLLWPGGTSPRVCAVPVSSPGNQPLYGAGVAGMSPVYADLDPTTNETCFDNTVYHPEMCLMAVRNNPLEGWKPSIVVWPINVKHLQLAVRFATSHKMCIMVAGTGHDFLNRHSCPFGLFIRTTLLKESTWLPLVSPSGAFRFGSGIGFSEAHYAAAQQGRVVSSGWASTVGIIGWSLGGGHGPFAPAYGLGVDNILSLTVVDAAGDVLAVNSSSHSDLWRAMRGGGGSAWGVVVDITVRAHPIPAAGFTVTRAVWTGLLCSGMNSPLESLLAAYKTFVLGLGANFGGLTYFTPIKMSTPIDGCSYAWEAMVLYIYLGSASDAEYLLQTAPLAKFRASYPASQYNVTSLPNWYDYVESDLEPITPVPWLTPQAGAFAGGIPSVLVNRSSFNTSAMPTLMLALNECITSSGAVCNQQQLFQDITGNIGSPASSATVSISPGLRSGIIHWVVGQFSQADLETYVYPLGENSYFSESAYEMERWQERLWGNATFQALTAVKKAYDPENVFWCRHCVSA